MISPADVTTLVSPRCGPLRQATLGALVLVLFLSGCTTQRQISLATEQGASAGRSDGRSTGEAKGFREAFPNARSKAYRQTLWSLYWSGDFQRQPLYRTGTVALGIILGLALQWGLFFWLRRSHHLLDIDFILVKRGQNILGGLLIAAGLISSSGCTSPVQKAWKSAYDSEFHDAYQEGLLSGQGEGIQYGRERGEEQAQEAARTGESWWLYTDLIAGGGILGLLIGTIAQYASLFVVRLTGTLDEFWAKLFVPGMATSASYGWLIGRRDEIRHYQEQVEVIDQNLQATCAQMKSDADRKVAALAARSHQIDVRNRRLVQDTEIKLASIARSAETTASQSHGTSLRRARCPHCNAIGRYKPECAGKKGRCGSCRAVVRMPPKRD